MSLFCQIYFFMSVVQLLLSHGADPNQRDSLGNTPLHLGKTELSPWPVNPVALWLVIPVTVVTL